MTPLAVSEWGFLDSSFVQLVDRQAAGVLVQGLGLAVAAGVGAVHALAPGHGKALIGAYLTGAQGRARDAVALGGVVASMHTGSVLVLGSVFYLTQRMPTGERLGSMLAILSAAAVTAVGVAMLWRQRGTFGAYRPRRQRGAPVGVHAADVPHRPHADRHAHQHVRLPDGVHAADATHRPHADQHARLPGGVAPLSRSGLVALATTGGLLPSPAAFLVLTSALAMGRVGYGLALVAAFSLGLAATLTAVGLAVLAGRTVLERNAQRRSGLQRLVGMLAPLGAAGVLAGGLLMAGAAIARL